MNTVIRPKRLLRCLIVAWLSVAAGCGGGGAREPATPTPTPPPPAPPALVVPADELAGWTLADVSEATAAALADIVSSIPVDHPGVDALAVAHRGHLVVDLTFRTGTDRFDADVGNLDPRLHAELSVTKSLAAILVGIAMEQGDLPADTAAPYLPLFPYPDYANPDPRKSAIALADVLAMRLGIDWNEWQPPYSSPDNQLNRFLREQHDFTKALLDRPMAADPGAVFAYNTVATTTLGDAIDRAQPLALEDYAATYLLAPLDISQVAVLRTPTGLPDLGRGLFLRARDLLKFGQLVLDDGIWRGRRIVSDAWLDTVVIPRTEIVWSTPEDYRWQLTGYGYLWWTGTLEHAGRTFDTVAARGFGDQILMVVPELALVIVINSGNFDTPSRERALFALIADRILPVFVAR